MGPIFVTTHRTHPGGMITTPVGPTFMQNDGRSGAKSGDHTQPVPSQAEVDASRNGLVRSWRSVSVCWVNIDLPFPEVQDRVLLGAVPPAFQIAYLRSEDVLIERQCRLDVSGDEDQVVHGDSRRALVAVCHLNLRSPRL